MVLDGSRTVDVACPESSPSISGVTLVSQAEGQRGSVAGMCA